ncbi:GTPase HflX [Candidatus Bathyarchaeota archaeon]|nr:MAG: GTPase HflX [Candidatus Bathyarchaeota archaeon]
MIVDRRDPFEKSRLEELKSLAEAAGYEVVGFLEQVTHPHSRYYIGEGKAHELAEMASELGVERIIFGEELKVTQIYNLAKLTGLEIIDRFQLILEIFQRRASTREAKLQIELARWRYELAHAKEKVRLAKMGEQPGFMGLGKYEIDVYREAVKRQVLSIQEKLKRVRKTRELHRQRRRKIGFPTVSLAGYTNSGKSTLFRALTGENVPIDQSLFTTLSTTTRVTNLFGEPILVTDTVGFIDRLPITLVEAFRSTLEETIFADLILLVVDVSESSDDIERKMKCCLDTLQEIGVLGVPILTVLNKIDLLSDKELKTKIRRLKKYSSNLTPISALYGRNLSVLKVKIADLLIKHIRSSIIMPINEESLSFLSWIYDHANVFKVAYGKRHLKVLFSARPVVAEKIRHGVENLGGAFKYEARSLHPQIKS